MEHLSKDVIKPLYMWPWPVDPEDMRRLRAAKAKLDTPFKVVPTETKPGVRGRVLALGTQPVPLCNEGFALVRNTSNEAALLAGLEWAITHKVDDRATTLLQVLEGIIPGIKEVDRKVLAMENISKKLNLEDDYKPRVRFM